MRNDSKFLTLILALSLAGILVSGWLLSTHIKFSTGSAQLTESCLVPAPGTSNEGCATIAVSQYSDVLGVPLAAIAMGFYFALSFLSFWAMRNPQASYEAIHVGFALSTLSILVTVTMAYISRFVVQSFCIGCSMLWLINLAIWPAFVKQMGLGWGQALSANLELFRPKRLNLLRARVNKSFLVSIVTVLLFSAIGVIAEGMQTVNTRFGDADKVVDDFRSAPQVFLPPEAYGGPQSKGRLNGDKAPVLDIVEFSDFQCPACRMAAQFFRPFLLKHADKVRFSYRHFPLDGSCNPHAPNGGHFQACAAARYSICAGEQGKFWEFHDLVFDNQSNLGSNSFEEFAKKLSLDGAKLEACLKSPSTEAQLQKEMQWGELVSLESTPTIIINGRKLSGALAPSQLESLLKALENKDSMETHGKSH